MFLKIFLLVSWENNILGSFINASRVDTKVWSTEFVLG
jgi:hypothetical protein